MMRALTIATALYLAEANDQHHKTNFAGLFDEWKTSHGKEYSSAYAEAKAFAAFAHNEEKIQRHNALGLSYQLGHNEFSDLTADEFFAGRLGFNATAAQRPTIGRHVTPPGFVAPTAVDWNTKGAVTPIKNQGICGSCWSFSATGAMEGALQIATGKLVSLSEEVLVQCDTATDNGCQGGLMDNAFMFAQKNGIAADKDYPYTSGTGIRGLCDDAKEDKPVMHIAGHKDVAEGDEDALLSAVAQQPVSIAIEADKSAFQLYKSGVLDSSACGEKLDHGVLVVGYGTDSSLGKDYWKVKNSWGTTWGEQGYIRMVRGKDMCGIAQQASYPTGAKAMGPTPPSPPSPTPPSPTPPSPPAGKSHYGDPKDGCLTDEIEISIQGVSGDFCTPKCSFFKACPKDVPTGVTARPQCALQDASKPMDKYCALICSPTLPILDQKAADDQCGASASCKPVQMGIGLCTYDD